jgi:hypothetical protein
MAAGGADRMRMVALTGLADHEWDAALQQSGKPFRFSHRAAAGRALEAAEQSYEYAPARADYEDGTSLLFALVKMRRRLEGLSIALGMPLGLEGTPIALRGAAQPAHLGGLVEALDDCGAIEIYGGAGGSPPEYGEVGHHETHTLDLSGGFDAVWTGSLTAKNRNMVRKAQRAGIAVASETAPEAVTAFAALHARNAQSWGPAGQPSRADLFEAVMATGHAELWLARVHEQVVAGALLLRGSHDLLYWAGAMDRDHRAAAPSNAALAAAIESACERGIGYLDFGSSAGLPGVEAFKKSFGGRPAQYSSATVQSRRYRRLEWARRRVGSVRAGP